jgi:hypothetical protein
MYYKLPVKQRLEYMNSFRKANPRMSYHDMVKDYNETFKKFDNGGVVDSKPEKNYKDKKELEFSNYRRPGPVASENPNDYFWTANSFNSQLEDDDSRPNFMPQISTLLPSSPFPDLRDSFVRKKDFETAKEKNKQQQKNEEVPRFVNISNSENTLSLNPTATTTYAGGKEQNSIANTNNEEYLRQKFLAQKNAEKDLRISDFLLKTTSYLPGTAGLIGGVANATKNIAEDDYKGALSEIVSTFAPKGELKGAAKIYSFYNDFIKDKPEKSYGTTQFYSDEDIKRILDNKNKSITKQ